MNIANSSKIRVGNESIVSNALKQWNLSEEKVTLLYESINSTTWKIGEKYIMKCNSNKEQLLKNIHLSNHLLSENITTPVYIVNASRQLMFSNIFCGLMERVPGSHIDFHAHPELIRKLGSELARLHIAFINIESKYNVHADNDFLTELENCIKLGLANVSDEILKHVESELLFKHLNLPRQMIHKDVHPQNIMFHEGETSGWLDFDLVCKDIRIFDIAHLLDSLILERHNNHLTIGAWHKMWTDLLTGYNEISSLTCEEIEILPVLMVAIEVWYAAYWQNNNYSEGSKKASLLAKWLYDNCVKRK